LQNKEHQYDGKKKQELKDKASNTLEDLEQNLKPRTLDREALSVKVKAKVRRKA
jgi:hypothetical protein